MWELSVFKSKVGKLLVVFPGKGVGLGFSLSGLLRIPKGRGVGAMGPADFFTRKNAVEVDMSLQKCG